LLADGDGAEVTPLGALYNMLSSPVLTEWE